MPKKKKVLPTDLVPEAVKEEVSVYSSVRQARASFLSKLPDILQGYIDNAKLATAAGNFEVAEQTFRYLLEHSTDDKGESVISPSIDKKKEVSNMPAGPSVQIGIALGGLPDQKALPEVKVVDIPKKDKDGNSVH